MKHKLILVLMVFSVFVTGCYTTYQYDFFNIEVLQPAIIFKNDSIKNIAVIYNNCNTKNDSINNSFVYNTEILYDTINSDSLSSRVYFDSFIRTLRNEQFFDTIIQVENTVETPGNDSIYVFSESEVDSIRSSNNINTFYSLDLYNINEIAYTHNVNNETGMVIFIRAVWSIFQAPTDTGFFIVHSDTITFTKDYASYRTREIILNDRPNLINETADDLGRKFANFSIPHWEEVERMYYTSGNILFSEALKLANENKWMEAAEIWQQLTKNKNKNIAAKSMYNLAVACEMQGEFEGALDWVIKSFHVYGQKNESHAHNCIDYIRILTLRKKEIEKVQEQLYNQD